MRQCGVALRVLTQGLPQADHLAHLRKELSTEPLHLGDAAERRLVHAGPIDIEQALH